VLGVGNRFGGWALLGCCVAAAGVIGLRLDPKVNASTGHASTSLASTGPDAKTPVLVELFTSEGCSSCPPADALLQSLDHEQNIPGAQVIVLSEHVDYWNYEGWRDPFSSPEVTERQKTYASRFSQDGPYTPEAVIDGTRGLNGSDRRGLIAAIEEAAQQPKIDIAITNPAISGKTASANVTAAAHPRTDLYAVLADDHDESSVLRGENSGRHIEHVAVVRAIEKLGSLNDGFARQIHVALPDQAHAKMRLVIFAQERGTGHILGVAESSM
jgi:hypothetical protein